MSTGLSATVDAAIILDFGFWVRELLMNRWVGARWRGWANRRSRFPGVDAIPCKLAGNSLHLLMCIDLDLYGDCYRLHLQLSSLSILS